VSSLLLSPHNDDAELFACWTLLREQPHVIVCLRSMVQEKHRSAKVTWQERERETQAAMDILGISWTQLPVPDDKPNWEQIELYLNEQSSVGHVYAPAWEPKGHPDHNMVARLADELFGADKVTHYMTYQAGTGHSESENEVPYEPEWLALKMQALACYRSQMREPSCRPWFSSLLELREWYA
jgi:LmbE family N-acetylglucosaminyl deacetylase